MVIEELKTLSQLDRVTCCSDGLGLHVRRDYLTGDGSSDQKQG